MQIPKSGELVLSMDQFPNNESELKRALTKVLKTDLEGRERLKHSTLINIFLTSTGETRCVTVPRYFQNIDWSVQPIQYTSQAVPELTITPLALLSTILKFPKLKVLKVEADFAPIWDIEGKRLKKRYELLPDGSKVTCLRADFSSSIEVVEKEFICNILSDLYITDHTNSRTKITSVWFQNHL